MATKTITSNGVRYNKLATVNASVDGLDGAYSVGDSVNLVPGTAPKAEYTIIYEGQQLTAGAYTLNLTAGPDGGNLTNSYIRSIWIKNRSTNTAALRVDVGASNGINFGGASTDDITIPIGWHLHLGPAGSGAGNGTQVTASVKNIDLSSSDTDATFDVVVVAGT